MPGFADVITAEHRWDLVNFVRALAQGYQSVYITGEIVPSRPWLPSIDFGFVDLNGRYKKLWDYQGISPVLLVLAREAYSRQRLDELSADAEAFAASNALIVVVLDPATVDVSDPTPANVLIVPGDTKAIFAAWSHYRRTALQTDPRDEAEFVGHMEFLIDRYGYVRARWRADEGILPASNEIVRQIEAINSEPQLLPPPSEHLHQ